MKLLSRLGLAFLLLLALTGCGSQMENDIKVQADLTEAKRQAQLDQVGQACVWVNRAIAVNPRALSTYVFISTDSNQGELGIASLGLPRNGVFSSVGNNQMLVKYMTLAVARLPNDDAPYQVLVQADKMLGDTANAKASALTLAGLLNKQLTKPGELHDESLMLALAQAECDAGNFTLGTADYTAVVHAFPNDFEPYNDLAYEWAVADSKPNLAQANIYAQKAITLATHANLPQSDIAAFEDTLGWVEYRQGNDKEALTNLQAAVSVSPRVPEERYHLAMVYAALGQSFAAHVEIDHALDLAPGYADAQNELAVLNQAASTPPAASPAAAPAKTPVK